MPTTTNIVRGPAATTAIEGPLQANWTHTRGGSTTRTFKGTQQDVLSLVPMYEFWGYDVKITQGPVWTLEATISWDASNGGTEPEPTVIWEIQGHAEQQNILECSDRPFIADLDTDTKAIIEAAMKYPDSAAKALDDIATYKPDQAELAYQVYSMMMAGIESKQLFVPTIRRTITVSRFYSSKWTLTNVDKVLSKNQIVSLYDVPDNVTELLPDSDTAIVTDADTGITTFKGYLEQYPTYQTTANNKVQIAQEWVFNKWSAGPNGLYDVVI